ILLLGGAGSGAMSVGSQAFSSASAERGVNVNVANDANAYVGYEKLPNTDGTVENGDSITLVRVRNQFSGGTSIGVVGVDIDDGRENVLNNVRIETNYSDQSGENTDTEEISRNFSTGEASLTFEPPGFADIIADVNGLDFSQKVPVEVTVKVKGSGVAAEIFGETRSFTIKRKSLGEYIDVQFQGESGRVTIKADQGGPSSVKAEAKLACPGSNSDNSECDDGWTGEWSDVNTNESLNARDFGHGNNGPTIEKIEIKGVNTFTRD
ncbi:MAG: hypothetical protein ACLFNC_05425, partial [Halodesulfurarchaeum sp.]